MNRKLLFIAIFNIAFVSAQFNPNAPWMKELEKSGSNITRARENNARNIYKFDEITTAFHEYWKDKDRKAKGNGYKPFMRWENYWKHFVKPDGYLPTAKELWETWQSKQASAGPVNPTSSWTLLGPVISGESAFGQPGIGRVNAVAVDPNNDQIWYAGAPAGGFWKSTDAGSNWTNIFVDFPQIGVSGVAIDPNDSDTIYIATGDDDARDSYSIGVFKSTDGGATWNPTGLGPDTQENFDVLNEIFIDPTNSDIIWVGGTQGLLKSLDAGDTWEVMLDGNVTDFRLKPDDPNTIYLVTGRTTNTGTNFDLVSYFKSTNGGDTFTEISDNLPADGGRAVLGVSPADPEVLYILYADLFNCTNCYQGLFKSVDGGDTFERTPNTVDLIERDQAWYNLSIAVSPTDANEVYTGAINIWKTTNGGESFVRLNNNDNNVGPAYTHVDIHTLKFFNGNLYAGTDGGFFVSDDSGASFSDFSDGLAITQFYRISIAKNNASKMVGGTQDNSGFAFNNGEWNIYTLADGMDYEIDPTNSNVAYGFSQFGGLLFITNNLGQSAGIVQAPSSGNVEGNWITPLAVSSEGEVFAAYSAVYKLVGSEWEQVSNIIAPGNNIDDLEIDPNNPQIMYAADQGNLYRSVNGGEDFVLLNETDSQGEVIPFDSQISDIAINNNDSNIVYLTTSTRVGVSLAQQPNQRNVYKVTIDGDAVQSRERITFDLPTDQAYFAIIHQPRNTTNPIYVGTSLGVYRLDDTLNEWEQYDTGFPNTAVSDLEISPDDGVIVASTYGRGVWQSPIPVEVPDDDIRLLNVSVIDGERVYSCNELTPQITLENTGLNTITQINVVYNINGNANENFTINETLNTGQIETFPLPDLDVTEGQLSTLHVTASVTNDAFEDNNTQEAIFVQSGVASGDQLFDFETDATALASFNTAGIVVPIAAQNIWERGVAEGTLLNTTSSGNQVIGTNLDGNYTDATTGILLSGCYDLSTIVAPKLSFQMAYDLENNFDIVYVVYSTDNFDSFEVLGTVNSQPNWYTSDRTNASSGPDDDCQNCPGAQWTGTNTDLTTYTYDFVTNASLGEPDLTGETNIQFAVVFVSDPFVTQEGVIIDNFIMEGFQDDEDDDNDGILDVDDNCPLIANADQADNDNDGEGDACDPDDDNDGILDTADNCPFTANPDQADGDGDGIGDVCDDDLDNDGVGNVNDICPDTPSGAVVDVDGCEIFSLPANNFSLRTIGESCISTNNGSIEITTANPLNYTATLTVSGSDIQSLEFTDTGTFENLSSGDYTLCVTVEGQPEYEICFELNITQPEPLGVSSSVSSLSSAVTLTFSGGREYLIELNGEAFITSNSEITLPLNKIENVLQVRTDKECQGVYQEIIVLTDQILVYPNPVSTDELSIYLGSNEFDQVELTLFTMEGTRIVTKQYYPENGYVRMNLSGMANGIYLLNIKTDNSLLNYKILKK